MGLVFIKGRGRGVGLTNIDELLSGKYTPIHSYCGELESFDFFKNLNCS